MLQKDPFYWFVLVGLTISFQALNQSAFSQANSCVSGKINSHSDHQAVPFAKIILVETGQVSLTDSLGNFKFCGLSLGPKTIRVSQLGFDSARFTIEIGKRKTIFHLKEKNQWLDAIDIVGHHRHFQSDVAEAQSLNEEELDRSRGTSLGELMRKIPGVSAIQTGPTVFKPVIQGMYGQRIAIVNNGAKIEGQSWGFDHAPEIDPSGSDEIVVVKGAQAVRFGSDAIGGVVLAEPGEISRQSLSLKYNSGFMTNGRGFFQSILLENSHQKKHRIDWRIQAGGKKMGDFQTAKYNLGNTAFQEGSAMALVRHQYKGWKSELFATALNSQIGIFKGSHISSPDGIRQAINRPDSTYHYPFSYSIGRPYQNISHWTGKAKTEYRWSENASSQLQLVHQEDTREEFDLQRISTSGCTDCPQLRFVLKSTQLDASHKISSKDYEGKYGLSSLLQTNITERNILIPNFRLYHVAGHSIHTWYVNKWILEVGGRLEWRHQQIFRYVDQTLDKPAHQYLNYMANVGARFQINDHWHSKLNAQISERAPNVNELYSNGVHHGTAAFEKGNDQLNQEKILNLSYSIHQKSERWQLLANIFETFSPNYIYLTPAKDSIVTTVRGPFPFYEYQASKINMYGADLFAEYSLSSYWFTFIKGSTIRSWNFSLDNYLIFQPADRLELGFRYEKKRIWNDLSLNWTGGPTMVRKQNRVPEHVDLADSPPAYLLWNSRLALKKTEGKIQFDLSIEGQNLTNEAYRDYMNRFRYFAYDLGRNWTTRLAIYF